MFLCTVLNIVLELFGLVTAKMKYILTYYSEDTGDSAKVLKGMQQVAKDKAKGLTPQKDSEKAEQPVKAKRWDEALERPNLDYR